MPVIKINATIESLGSCLCAVGSNSLLLTATIKPETTTLRIVCIALFACHAKTT